MSANNRSSVKLLSLTKEHISTIFELEKRCFSHHWSERSITAEFELNYSLNIGAFQEEGDLIAYSLNHLLDEELHLLKIAVKERYRGSGFATCLVEEVLLRAVSMGARRAYLEVRPRNESAKALYKKFGFLEVGLRPNYYQDNLEAAIVMEKEFF